ncbi:MAG: hypothetical protein QNJ46_06700 [Leptolyngbyaceae cyanobacterium MO_188.B28]|nr:hypothetical protein [Leptolyngbyaceae cyanobacterium MO_188.B28]
MAELQSNIDNKTIFAKLWDLSVELRQRIEVQFELHPDPSTTKLKSDSSPIGEAKGSFNAFSGPEIDWLVHSWLKNPSSGFSNMHLTIWLGPHIRVPHLAFAFATIPESFLFIDYVARTDLSTDLAYLDQYYEPANPTYLMLQSDPRLSPFISKSTYIRQVLSATSLCYTGKSSEEFLELTRTVAHEMLDRWLIWVDEAQSVPHDKRVALAERDLFVRRTIAERDPANLLVEKIFGPELTNILVRALWGGDRGKI